MWFEMSGCVSCTSSSAKGDFLFRAVETSLSSSDVAGEGAQVRTGRVASKLELSSPVDAWEV